MLAANRIFENVLIGATISLDSASTVNISKTVRNRPIFKSQNTKFINEFRNFLQKKCFFRHKVAFHGIFSNSSTGGFDSTAMATLSTYERNSKIFAKILIGKRSFIAFNYLEK